MHAEHYDVVIIGTGAGGGTMLHELAQTGARVLVIERGDVVPTEDENWDPDAVWKQLRYRTTETWLDAEGREFRPYTHYAIGGNTKFWGAVLYRLRREDFQELQHVDGVSPAWPIDYDTLAPFYDRAERLYQVHGKYGPDPTEPPRGPFPFAAIPHQPRVAEIVDGLRRQGLHPSPLPLGLLRPGEPGGCILCDTCNSFPCKLRFKSDADVCCVEPALRMPNVTLWTRAHAERLITDPSGRRVEAIDVIRDGQTHRVSGNTVVVSCGAVNSAALLLRSATGKHPEGLANSSGLVGRRYMAHLATMMQAFSPLKKNPTVFQKTVAVNDFYLRGPDWPYPMGQIQSQGRTHAIMAKTVGDTRRYLGMGMDWIPPRAYHEWVSRATDWLAMSEDLPTDANRVLLAPNGKIVLDYRPNNARAHARLVDELRRVLARLGYWSPKPLTHSAGVRNTTHQCGTLVFGADSRRSVLDPYCRTHDVENLFVVDASFFPSSAAVNPGLTIVAQAFRVAEHMKEHDLS